MQIQSYLFFDGRCEEALAFYQKAIGAEIQMLLRVKDSPDQSMATPGKGDNVLHAAVRIGDTTVLASDGHGEGKPVFQGFALSLTVANDAEADRLFAAVGDGGQVQLPLTKTFFSSRFGMLTDRFGVMWMIYVAP